LGGENIAMLFFKKAASIGREVELLLGTRHCISELAFSKRLKLVAIAEAKF
jgi:hypothetical protein